MRAPNNKRARGRANRRAPNPNRSYESNGPEGKIRGNANQVYEKYSQLARDALASGDPIAAEGFWQHAEHYYRIMNAQQAARQQHFAQQDYDGTGLDGDDRDPSELDQPEEPRRPQAPQQQDERRQPAAQEGEAQGGDEEPAEQSGEESDTAGVERVVRRSRGRRSNRRRAEGEVDADGEQPDISPLAAEDAAD